MAISYFEEILEEVSDIDDDRELFEMFIDMGEDLDEYDEEWKTAERKVSGCVSNVYIYTEIDEDDGTFEFYGCSDALTVKGYLAVMIEALSGLDYQEIKAAKPLVEKFILESGIGRSVVQSRANAMVNIYLMMLDQAEELTEEA